MQDVSLAVCRSILASQVDTHGDFAGGFPGRYLDSDVEIPPPPTILTE